MRILQVIDSLAFGGAEKLILETVPLMVEKGIVCDVAVLNGIKTPFYNELVNNGCCKIYDLNIGSVYNPISIFTLFKIIKNYDVVHVHLFPAQYFAVIAKLMCLCRIKLVFTEHNTENSRMGNRWFRLIEKIIYSQYLSVICITEEVKKSLIKNLSISESKLKVITNGVNIELIKASSEVNRKELGFCDSDKLLIMVAGFRHQKDHDTLVRALSLLDSNYKLLLVGDGANRSKIEKLVLDLGLSNRVCFLGNRTDVYGLFKMCDIAILSSHWEGFGLVAAEAMASGTPLIASNVSGLAQVVEGGGLLFEKGNVNDLFQKVKSLEDMIYYDSVSELGILRASKFDITLMVEDIIKLYEKV